ncbi:helical backbone metal receptor [bacterium]|nr:helical backbone metal receptor [bacterium]
MHEKKAKIVCLVPSWTETLLEAGLNVVGRTRFCIHPAEKVKNIAVVGGTKNFKLDEILALNPDFVILDKEENKKEMADALIEKNIKVVASHVESLQSASDFLAELSQAIGSQILSDYADLYKMVLNNRSQISRASFFNNSVIQKNAAIDFGNIDYVIWKNPFMVIGKNTFIADVFSLVGIELKRNEKYPEVGAEELKNKFVLFSSEPYPFAKDFKSLTAEGYKAALIDGEKISWYGIRNIRFLESCL